MSNPLHELQTQVTDDDHQPAKQFQIGQSTSGDNVKVGFTDDGIAMRESMIKDVDAMKKTFYIKNRNFIIGLTVVAVTIASAVYYSLFQGTNFLARDCQQCHSSNGKCSNLYSLGSSDITTEYLLKVDYTYSGKVGWLVLSAHFTNNYTFFGTSPQNFNDSVCLINGVRRSFTTEYSLSTGVYMDASRAKSCYSCSNYILDDCTEGYYPSEIYHTNLAMLCQANATVNVPTDFPSEYYNGVITVYDDANYYSSDVIPYPFVAATIVTDPSGLSSAYASCVFTVGGQAVPYFSTTLQVQKESIVECSASPYALATASFTFSNSMATFHTVGTALTIVAALQIKGIMGMLASVMSGRNLMKPFE